MSHESIKTVMTIKYELRDQDGNLIEAGTLDDENLNDPKPPPLQRGNEGDLRADLNAQGKTINNTEEP